MNRTINFTSGRTQPAWSGRVLALSLVLASLVSQAEAQRKMESLDRGVVAVRASSTEAFVSWRLLGLDPAGIEFNLYRSGNGGAWTLIHSSAPGDGCNYTDATANLNAANTYRVHPVVGGVEQASDGQFTLAANTFTGPLLRIPLERPADRKIEHVSIGDLDGDGAYEYVITWTAEVAGTSQMLQAYKLDGTLLWEYDAGIRSTDQDDPRVFGTACIRAGQWDGVVVYDLDSDGRAEVVVKSADGVIFGDGTRLNHPDSLTQFLSVLDGMSGTELARTELTNPWKTLDNKRSLSVLFGIGYPDGALPSLMIHAKSRTSTGAFNTINSAWDYRDGVISNRWSIHWDGAIAPQAGHQMRLVDLDGDGKDELFPGVHAVNDDGSLLYDMGDWDIKHGDRWQVGDLDPNRPGQEIFGVQQNNSSGLRYFVADAADGQLEWEHTVPGTLVDVGRGSAVDIDPRYPGMEVWAFDGVHAVDGTWITTANQPWPNLTVWWDGDLLGENLNENIIEKWRHLTENMGRTLTCYRYFSARANSRSVTPFYGDIIGDWREEVLFEGGDNREWLLVFTTDVPTTERLYTLAHNPAYRNCMTVKGYLQQNLPDYYLGEGMATPPQPNIVYATLQPPSSTPVPTGLEATADSDTQVGLNWTPSPNALGYNLKRSTSMAGPYTAIATGLTETTYTDSGLTFSTDYFYKVSTVYSAGESLDSTEAYVRTDALPGTVAVTHAESGIELPGVVADYSGVLFSTSEPFDMNGGNAVALLLTAEGVTDDAGFSGLSATFAGQAMMAVTSVDPGAGVQSATVFYLVNPTITAGTFEVMSGAGVTGDISYSQIAIGNVAGLADTGTSGSTSSSNGTPLDVSYSTATNHGFVLGAAANNDFNYARRLSIAYGNADTDLQGHTVVGSSGHFHTYGDVAAAGTHTDGYYGQYQRTAIVTVAFESQVGTIDNTPPAAPTGLVATAGDGAVALEWEDNLEPDLAGYTVYRSSASGGEFSPIAHGVGVSSYDDSAVTNGTNYYYIVTAFDASANESANSGEVPATPLSPEQEWRLLHFDSIENAGNAADDADPDRDGNPNWAERLLNLDPNDSNSVFRLTISPNGPTSFILSWRNAQDAVFRVESTDDLRSPWTSEESIPGSASPEFLTRPVAQDGPSRFYRIAIEAP